MENIFNNYCKDRNGEISINQVTCGNCPYFKKLTENIKEVEEIIAFRAATSNEIEGDSHKRGNIKEIYLSEENLQAAVSEVFSYVRNTLNNEKAKLFSYSKCFVVPLFKFNRPDDSTPLIVIKRLILNAFDIVYNCTYQKKQETRNDIEVNRVVEKQESISIHDYLYYGYMSKEFTEVNEEIDAKNKYNQAIFNHAVKNNIDLGSDTYDANLLRKYLLMVNGYIYKIKNDEEKQEEMYNLKSVDNVRIRSFCIDLSKFEREWFNQYLQYCSRDGKRVKDYAAFQKDYEVITSLRFDEGVKEPFLIRGKVVIDNLKVLTICLLFSNEFRSKNKKIYEKIFQKYINLTIESGLSELRPSEIDIVVEYLKKNWQTEIKAFIVIKKSVANYGEDPVDALIKFLDEIPKETTLSQMLINEILECKK